MKRTKESNEIKRKKNIAKKERKEKNKETNGGEKGGKEKV